VTIILSGLGLDTDAIGSSVAFGLTIENLTADTPVSTIAAAGIEQWYVIDFRQRAQMPVNAKQWAFLRNVIRVWKRSNRKLLRDTREFQAIERSFMRDMTAHRTVKDLYANPVGKARRHRPDVPPRIRGRPGRPAAA